MVIFWEITEKEIYFKDGYPHWAHLTRENLTYVTLCGYLSNSWAFVVICYLVCWMLLQWYNIIVKRCFILYTVGLKTEFLRVRENWKRSGNLSGQGKCKNDWKVREILGKILPFCRVVVMLIRVELESNPPYCSSSSMATVPYCYIFIATVWWLHPHVCDWWIGKLFCCQWLPWHIPS